MEQTEKKAAVADETAEMAASINTTDEAQGTPTEEAPATEDATTAEAPTTEETTIDSTEQQLRDALADAEEKVAAEHDRYLRQLAEFENYRKRTLKEKSELILNGSANLMTAVLPVLDDMDRALDALTKTDDAAACCEGFKLIASKFRTTLEQNGLKQIEAIGQPFDTDFHEAIAMMPATDDAQKGHVMDCVQAGYKLNDKVLRHAKVVVCE